MGAGKAAVAGARPAARRPEPEASQVSGPPLLSVDGLRMHFFTKAGVVKAVDDVNFTIEKGEFCVVLGPSGAGKTTILNLLGGMDD